jgi:hypothetical protein
MTMKNKELYQALGFTALLLASALPLGLLSMRVLNYLLGGIGV